MADQCNTCFYGRGIPLTCRKSTPNAVASMVPIGVVAKWLPVAATDWCGDFSGGDPNVYAGNTIGPQGLVGPQGVVGPVGPQGVGFSIDTASYMDKLTTVNATPTVVRSIVIPVNSRVFIDCIAYFQDTTTRLTGGYSWNTLSYGRGASGLPVAFGTLDILESHLTLAISVAFVINAGTNNIDITVTGKAATSIAWTVDTTTRAT